MKKFHVIAFANTLAIIDLVLHISFHIWISIAPSTYEWLMNLFVAGLHLKVTDFDVSFLHILLGTVLEAAVFWVIGATIALLYNRFSRSG